MFPTKTAAAKRKHDASCSHGASGTSAAYEEGIATLLVNSQFKMASVADEKGFMPLHLACRFCADNENLIAIILSANPQAASVAVQKNNDSSSSWNSASAENPAKRQKFVNSRAFSTDSTRMVLSSSEEGGCPLHIALANGASLGVVQLLVRQAPQVLRKSNAAGISPLISAIRHGADDKIIEFLLSTDKRVAKAQDKHMNLPLHHACMRGCSLVVVQQLVSAYPESIHFKNFNGKTPLDLTQSFMCCSDRVNAYLQEKTFPVEGEVADI